MDEKSDFWVPARAARRSNITERKQTEAAEEPHREALQQYAERLRLLHELDRAITASLRLSDIYYAFARHATRLLPYDSLSISLLKDDYMQVTYMAGEGRGKTALPVGATLPRQTSAMGWVVERGQPLLRHNIGADARFAEDERLIAGGIRSGVIIPLRVKKRVIGAWVVGERRVGAYSPDDMELAQSMADQLATAIENARLYKRAQQEISERQRAEETLSHYSERLETLREIDQAILAARSPAEIADEALHYLRRLIACQRVTVMLIDFDVARPVVLAVNGDGAAHLKVGQPISSSAFGSGSLLALGQGQPQLVEILSLALGQPHLVDDALAMANQSPIDEQLLAEGIRSYLLVPLVYQGELIGSLNLGADNPGAFSGDDVEIGREVANLLTVAIQNAQLYDKTHQQAEELTALNVVSQAIIASLDLEEILTLVIDNTTRLLGAAAASVVLYDEIEDDLWFAITSGQNADFVRGQRLAMGQGIVGWVARHGEPLLVPDVGQDDRFFADFDQQSNFTTHSILCVPLQVKGQLIGAIEVINKENNVFTRQDQWLLSLLARPAAIAIENAQLFTQAQQELRERKQAQAALRRSEEHFRALIENASDIITRVDADGRILYASPSVERLLGYQSAALVGQNAFEFIHPDDVPNVRKGFGELVQNPEAPRSTEFRFLHKDGSWRILESIGKNLLSHASVAGIILNSRDITKRKQAEEELRQAHAELEIRVEARTVELSKANAKLRQQIAERKQAEQALALSQERYALAVGAGRVGVWDWDIKTNQIYLDPSLKAILGYEDHEIKNRLDDWINLAHPDDMDQVVAAAQAHLDGLTPQYEHEHRMLHKDGSICWVLVRGTAMRDESGKVYRVMGTQTDITELKWVQAALHVSEERYALAARGANDGLWDWNLDTNEIYFSPRWNAMLGYEESDTGNSLEKWFTQVHPEDIEQLEADIAAHREGKTSDLQNEHRMLHTDGSYRWMLCRGLSVRDSKGRAYRMAGSLTDITQRKMIEKQLSYDASHDALTRLPNQVLFLKRLDRAVERAKQDDGYLFAVLFLDLDRFKVINDSLGHQVGDQLLRTIADRLKACVRPGDVVSRLGGDEFTILLNDIKQMSAVTRIADCIQKEVAKPVNLSGQVVFPTVSIGITLSTEKYERSEDLLRDADTAMYGAKAAGRAQHKLFETDQHTRAMILLRLEGALQEAVRQQEFQVHYQPIVSLSGDRIVGAEALLRWQHPQRGLIGPEEFISLAEETGLIVSIGDWMLRTVCAQVKAWQATGYSSLRVALNVSARQFGQKHLLKSITDVLGETGLAAQLLELEIVEQTAVEDAGLILASLDELKAMGIQISVDDFGMGSSLRILKNLPFNTLKVGQSFIKGITTEDEAIAAAIIAMAHRLNLKVVAVGVETEDQLAFLRAQQCDEMQGNLFSPPLSVEAFTKLLEQGQQL